MSRRRAISTLAHGTALAVGASAALLGQTSAPPPRGPLSLKGNIRHSVSRWCFGKIPFDDFCIAVKAMGVNAIDLVGPEDFHFLQKHGMSCSLVHAPSVNGIGSIPRAWNRREHHDILVQAYESHIEKSAKAGFKSIVCFSGNRDGLDDATGLANCVVGLKRITAFAERHDVTVCMELLNSKVNHADYQCDHSEWGVELVKQVGSTHFKLLYDIYHMQIMEGDICATIAKHHPHFAHYHTAGVPGRHEIDETQELHYPRIMQAILDTGYKGYVAQEFVPRGPDPLASLRAAFAICDI